MWSNGITLELIKKGGQKSVTKRNSLVAYVVVDQSRAVLKGEQTFVSNDRFAERNNPMRKFNKKVYHRIGFRATVLIRKPPSSAKNIRMRK